VRRHSDRVAPGDTYDDLIEAVERGMVASEAGLVVGELRERYTTELGAWGTMIGDLLDQIAGDAGSLTRGLDMLRVPPSLRDVWRRRDVLAGMDSSAAWLASQRPDALGRVALAPSVRALRGDTYDDLAEAVGSVAVAGDGALDPARLRRRYTVERAPWLRMVADLLAQVVGDAGSVERASTVLAVPLDSLLAWVRWFVSRGSIDAARSRWPVAPIGDAPETAAYDDLAEAVERGAVDGDNAIDPPSVRDVYVVRLDSWDRMAADLLGQIVADAGSIRAAAKVLAVPRATLGTWVQRRRASDGLTLATATDRCSSEIEIGG
jgi:hypothetical protein